MIQNIGLFFRSIRIKGQAIEKGELIEVGSEKGSPKLGLLATF